MDEPTAITPQNQIMDVVAAPAAEPAVPGEAPIATPEAGDSTDTKAKEQKVIKPKTPLDKEVMTAIIVAVVVVVVLSGLAVMAYLAGKK